MSENVRKCPKMSENVHVRFDIFRDIGHFRTFYFSEIFGHFQTFRTFSGKAETKQRRMPKGGKSRPMVGTEAGGAVVEEQRQAKGKTGNDSFRF